MGPTFMIEPFYSKMLEAAVLVLFGYHVHFEGRSNVI